MKQLRLGGEVKLTRTNLVGGGGGIEGGDAGENSCNYERCNSFSAPKRFRRFDRSRSWVQEVLKHEDFFRV